MSLYVWGTGCGAGELMEHGLSPEQVSAFLDSESAGGTFLGRPVIRPEALQDREAACILVASRQSQAIAARAQELGFAPETLLFLKNNWTLQDRNRSYAAAEGLLESGLLEDLKRPPHGVREPLWVRDSVLTERDLENDYVRMRTLEAICRQIGDLPGAAAELGVYRGAFARCINALLPERLLYLFDTFAGFDDKESEGEAAGFVQAHRNTSAEAVLRLLPHPQRVRLMPGLFPASLNGLEERFVLVSLDVDLEESTLAGLRYFYPRLTAGGYLLLHDYNSPRLPGIKRAWERYLAERGCRIPSVPLCDINGTLVVCKP